MHHLAFDFPFPFLLNLSSFFVSSPFPSVMDEYCSNLVPLSNFRPLAFSSELTTIVVPFFFLISTFPFHLLLLVSINFLGSSSDCSVIVRFQEFLFSAHSRISQVQVQGPTCIFFFRPRPIPFESFFHPPVLPNFPVPRNSPSLWTLALLFKTVDMRHRVSWCYCFFGLLLSFDFILSRSALRILPPQKIFP